MNVPLMNPKAALDAVEPVWRANLDSLIARAQFVLGPELGSFEREFAAALQAPFAIGVASGTAAIELSLREAGITHPDQEVLTSPLTAPFTGIAIRETRGGVRFCEIDPETLLMDPADAASRVTTRTAALVPVHLYGQPCHLDALSKLGLPIIQDACQAHGATLDGKPLTHWSPWVTYSFYPTKNLGGVGDGGAILTSDPGIAERLSILRDGGRREAHTSSLPGINARLDDIQCCFLRALLPNLAQGNARRAQIAAQYDDALRDFEPVRPVVRRRASVHHLYVVRAERRDALRQYLAGQGIGTGIHYAVPLHLQPTFQDCGLKPGSLPHAEKACREIVSLPIWPQLTEGEVGYICENIRRFYECI